MEKIVERGLLYDFYGPLLTEHQQAIYEANAYDNLSLSEIAEQENVSRQAVHDIIKRCDKTLMEYEEKLQLLGYIPRTQLDWYEDFNEDNVPCPFVGEIELDRSSARLIAEIKVIIPSSREFVEQEIIDEL